MTRKAQHLCKRSYRKVGAVTTGEDWTVFPPIHTLQP